MRDGRQRKRAGVQHMHPALQYGKLSVVFSNRALVLLLSPEHGCRVNN
jgi:hypothetical protein